MARRHTLLPLALLTVTLAGCALFSGSRGADSSPADSPAVRLPTRGGSEADREWDRSILDQMERDARRLANADACRNAPACRTAPIGVKACGGPRDHIVYCATATDTAALFRKLEELARAERAYNEKYAIVSTCELRLAPTVVLAGQTCRAVR